MSKITYTNKVDLYEDTSIADINKVKASDMNEIKTVVNNNDNTTTTNTNAIGTLTDLSTTNKDNLVNAINELSVDYIVEQGTSGIWSYRKWNSGVSECWTTSLVDSGTHNMSKNGNIYVSSTHSYNFPTDLFINVPILSANVQQGGGMWAKATGSTTATTAVIAFLRSNDDGGSITFNMEAKGQWK